MRQFIRPNDLSGAFRVAHHVYLMVTHHSIRELNFYRYSAAKSQSLQ